MDFKAGKRQDKKAAGKVASITGKLTLEKVKEAAECLAGVVHYTPAGLENLQKTGSFKIRGAYNKVMSPDEDEIN